MKTEKKIYEITYTVSQAYTSYVYAESKEGAEEKASAIIEHNSDSLEVQWGSDEIDSNITASDEPMTAEALAPDYRGDGAKIADKNENNYKEIEG